MPWTCYWWDIFPFDSGMWLEAILPSACLSTFRLDNLRASPPSLLKLAFSRTAPRLLAGKEFRPSRHSDTALIGHHWLWITLLEHLSRSVLYDNLPFYVLSLCLLKGAFPSPLLPAQAVPCINCFLFTHQLASADERLSSKEAIFLHRSEGLVEPQGEAWGG